MVMFVMILVKEPRRFNLAGMIALAEMAQKGIAQSRVAHLTVLGRVREMAR